MMHTCATRSGLVPRVPRVGVRLRRRAREVVPHTRSPLGEPAAVHADCSQSRQSLRGQQHLKVPNAETAVTSELILMQLQRI